MHPGPVFNATAVVMRLHPVSSRQFTLIRVIMQRGPPLAPGSADVTAPLSLHFRPAYKRLQQAREGAACRCGGEDRVPPHAAEEDALLREARIRGARRRGAS